MCDKLLLMGFEFGALNHSVFLFYWGPMSTTVILTLISDTVYPHLPALSNHSITLNRASMSPNSLIHLTSLFQSDWMTSFKFWHLFVMRKNTSVRNYYSQSKIFEVKMQQKFWTLDWELLLLCTCWVCSSDVLKLSPGLLLRQENEIPWLFPDRFTKKFCLTP